MSAPLPEKPKEHGYHPRPWVPVKLGPPDRTELLVTEGALQVSRFGVSIAKMFKRKKNHCACRIKAMEECSKNAMREGLYNIETSIQQLWTSTPEPKSPMATYTQVNTLQTAIAEKAKDLMKHLEIVVGDTRHVRDDGIGDSIEAFLNAAQIDVCSRIHLKIYLRTIPQQQPPSGG